MRKNYVLFKLVFGDVGTCCRSNKYHFDSHCKIGESNVKVKRFIEEKKLKKWQVLGYKIIIWLSKHFVLKKTSFFKQITTVSIVHKNIV